MRFHYDIVIFFNKVPRQMRLIFAVLLILAGCALALPSTATLVLCSVNPEPECGLLLLHSITYLAFGGFMVIVGLVIRKPRGASEEVHVESESTDQNNSHS